MLSMIAIGILSLTALTPQPLPLACRQAARRFDYGSVVALLEGSPGDCYNAMAAHLQSLR